MPKVGAAEGFTVARTAVSFKARGDMSENHPKLPVCRPGLFTNGDLADWVEQFHFLAYVLRMSAMQIAQIDLGYEPDHPDAQDAWFYAKQIERKFPLVQVEAMFRGAGGFDG